MTYEITLNQQFNSYEIKFDGKPADAIREALKALKFRWNPKKGVWYGFGEAEEVKKACDGEKVKRAATKAAKPDTRAFEAYMEEMNILIPLLSFPG